MCYAPCVEIIDWWHVVEKIWEAANSLWGQGEAQPVTWIKHQKERLWAGQLRPLLHEIRRFARVVSPSILKSGRSSVISFTTAAAWIMSLIARLVIPSAGARSSQPAKWWFKNE
jgi:hypothetical protein